MAWIPETGEGRFRVFQETKKGPKAQRGEEESKKQKAKSKSKTQKTKRLKPLAIVDDEAKWPGRRWDGGWAMDGPDEYKGPDPRTLLWQVKGPSLYTSLYTGLQLAMP